MTTGLLYDPFYLQHQTAPGHPESSQRLVSVLNHIRKCTWFEALEKTDAIGVDLKWVNTIHDLEYIKRAENTCKTNIPFLDSMDVSVCHDSYDVALYATGGVLKLADKIFAGNLDNGLALIRPPGHHAEKDSALGFCLFNNVAILARYLQHQYSIDRIMILDWDVHHGNGTQHAFEEDPSVLYVSIHQYPFYPGTGNYNETGTGRGKGATLNYPVPAGATDQDYEQGFREKILPGIDAFRPEAVIISAGFDAHRDDPLADVCLSTGFYTWMSERIMEKAVQYAGGKLISVLEGGYNLEKLPLCIEAHLNVLTGPKIQAKAIT